MSYTLSQHFARCYTPSGERVHFDAFVQVQSSRVTQCAKVREAWITEDGLEMWRVDLLGPLQGRSSFPAQKVIQCSGLDDHCACAGESCPQNLNTVFPPALTGIFQPSVTV